MLDKESEKFFSKYSKYKLPIEMIDTFSEKIDWEEKPRLTLILVGRSYEYEIYIIKYPTDIKRYINNCIFKDKMEIYIFSQKQKIRLESAKNYLHNRYETYYNNLHTFSFFKKVNIINSVLFLTFVSIITAVFLKYQWFNLGLPLEALNSGIFEDYLNILKLAIFELILKKMWLLHIIFSLAVMVMLFMKWSSDQHQYPKLKKYPNFYIKESFYTLQTVIISFFMLVAFSFMYDIFSKKIPSLV